MPEKLTHEVVTDSQGVALEGMDPEFGGHCVFGATRGQAFPGDPKAWTVANGRLFLSLNRFVRAVIGPTSARIAKAQTAWTPRADH